MRLFKKRQAPRDSSGNADDDQTLAQVVQHGADLAEPRHWVHYLYFNDEAGARAAAETISAAGWELRRVGESPVNDGTWSVVVEKNNVIVSPEAVHQARQFFEGLPGVDYDGWEVSL